MNTKEKRIESRKFWTKNMTLDPRCEGLDIEIYTSFDEVPNSRGQQNYHLTAFRGSAGKPCHHYYYHKRHKQQFEDKINEILANAKRWQEYKEEKAKERKSNHYITGAAACAKTIREELKLKFPDVKFSVRSKNYAGGDSVEISWVDGPLAKDVETYTNKYQAGYFDGMTDMYEYDHDRDPNLPGAKYVSCYREMSDETRALLKAKIEKDYAVNLDDPQDCQRKFHQWSDTILWRAFNNAL